MRMLEFAMPRSEKPSDPIIFNGVLQPSFNIEESSVGDGLRVQEGVAPLVDAKQCGAL